MTHRPPFESWHRLPYDVGVSFVLVTGALVAIGWDYVRPHMSHTLMSWGNRLA